MLLLSHSNLNLISLLESILLSFMAIRNIIKFDLKLKFLLDLEIFDISVNLISNLKHLSFLLIVDHMKNNKLKFFYSSSLYLL